MRCPFCGQDEDKVIDSRSSEGGRVVRRRRECLDCERRFTTYERVEETVRLSVVKKDGSREPYSRDKLLRGLEQSCYKRPISDAQLRQIADAVEEDIFKGFDKEVPSVFLGDVLASKLREVDKIAYVRFASVYREFADVGELIVEAQQAEATPTVSLDQPDLFPKDK